MSPQSILQRLHKDLSPGKEAQERVKNRIMHRLEEPQAITALAQSLTPKKQLESRIWRRIARSLHSPSAETLHHAKENLTPGEGFGLHLKSQIFLRLAPVQQKVVSSVPVLKWVAAFALFGLVIRLSPFLFLATPTIAESVVSVMPTRGEVLVSIGNMWHPVYEELALEPGMLLRTKDGEASLVVRDDGVMRMDENTTIEIRNLADQTESAIDGNATVALHEGKLWVQGLVPDHLRGLSISTPGGDVLVNEGSVSIALGNVVDVEVYDRRAAVQRGDQKMVLTAGERTEVWKDNILLVKKIPDKWYQRTWAAQNLNRDAVHRKDIAQLQHERRISQAGILPSSPLYPFKRIAEVVDVIFTFGEQARVQKKLQLAETRLNEAAALLAEGDDEDANATLDEYRGTLLALASGSGDGSLAQFLIQQAIAEVSSEVAAALPGDDAYPLKQAVLEAGSEISNGIVRSDLIRGELLLDGLASVMRTVEAGDTSDVSMMWHDVQPYLVALDDADSDMPAEVRKEAMMLLSIFAESLYEADARGNTVNPELLDDVAAFLPAPVGPTTVVLSEEEIMQIVESIREHIFVYDMKQSRINQFIAELRKLQGHPDLGRILRRLAVVLPEGPENFPERVYKEIVRLRWENAETVL